MYKFIFMPVIISLHTITQHCDHSALMAMCALRTAQWRTNTFRATLNVGAAAVFRCYCCCWLASKRGNEQNNEKESTLQKINIIFHRDHHL